MAERPIRKVTGTITFEEEHAPTDREDAIQALMESIGDDCATFVIDHFGDVDTEAQLREALLDVLDCLARGDGVRDDEVFARWRPLYDELRLP